MEETLDWVLGHKIQAYFYGSVAGGFPELSLQTLGYKGLLCPYFLDSEDSKHSVTF